MLRLILCSAVVAFAAPALAQTATQEAAVTPPAATAPTTSTATTPVTLPAPNASSGDSGCGWSSAKTS